MKKTLLFLLIAVWISFGTYAQNKTISGKVTSVEDGSTLPGVNIVVKGTTIGTVTDANGEYSIAAPEGSTLVFTFIGLNSQEVQVGGRTSINVQLSQNAQQLSEVVITTAGGLKAKEKEMGSANTVITTGTLNTGKAVNIAAGLQGKVAGLQINATGSGVNPDYRVILRGQRSLTGDNQALIVLDNVIVPASVFSNINPNDVESIVVLNGGAAAALYGSMASNGALIITTKKGKDGKVEINASNTTSLQQVAFLPKIQKKFGAGGTAYGTDEFGNPTFSYLENQSYGPAFDGVKRPLGPTLESLCNCDPNDPLRHDQDSTTYSYKDGHDKFWVTGVTNQSDFSLTSGDDKSSIYLSGQYVSVTGTTPGDKYNRATLRLNGTRKVGKYVDVTYSTSFTPNRTNVTSQTASIYSNMLNMPSNVDITKYKDWRNNKFANPNGFYNPWYQNPYFTADNYRRKTRNDFLTGSVEIKVKPLPGLDLIARQGISTRNFSDKYTTGAFDYTTWAENTDMSSKSDITGSVTETSNFQTQLLTDFLAQYNKTVGDFNFNVVAGGQWKQNENRYMTTYIGGLVINNLYNLSNGTGTPTYGESEFKSRLMGVLGQAVISYKDYLFVTARARNDWDSRLAAANRSFFYPSVDVSFVASEAIPAIASSQVVNYLKLRGGLTKNGKVNLGSSDDLGAYYLYTTVGSASGYGFPYNSLAGYTVNGTIVSNNLRPEITKGYEFGFDLSALQDRIVTHVTWYNTKTDDQTVSTNLAYSTGFQNLLTNVGQTQSKGLELDLQVTPFRNENWEVTVGGNYTYLDNTVNSIASTLDKITLGSTGTAISAAVAGKAFPVIMGYDYVRDDKGHVIVNSTTGLPTQTTSLVVLGNGTPKNRMGMNAAVSYKGLRFSILFEARTGYKIFNGVGPELDWSGTGYRTAVYDRKSFVFPNSVYMDESGNYVENKTVAIANGNGNNGFWSDGINRNVTSNYVTSGNFIKLREISIAYSLPASLLGEGKLIKDVTISVQGRNLFLWMAKDNIYADPEYSSGSTTGNGTGLNDLSQTPPTRTYGATLSVKF
ncbi:MAG TPA: SusC/RagA family TonB-linked outer membrane protein [Ohtaekwangia sp.]|uniref:SusC/RagA family TonB-linked outer membrane protein n=1 Tax=Ohtaekwangia sp. TaxID=2066019 RepID=UPI002F94186B